MASELKTVVREHVSDPQVAGLVIETVLQPLTGKGGLVAPPTYAGAQDDRSKAPRHAVSEGVFVPTKSGDWYSDIQRNDDGTPRFADRVLLDSVGSQSGRAEAGLWEQQERLGIKLPGFVVGGSAEHQKDDRSREHMDGVLARQLDDALSVEVSTWQAAHRQQDAWFRFAEAADESGEQVWQQDAPDSLKAILTSASAQNADLLYRYFANSAIYGFWLSSGTAARHRLPRAYSSEIVGYGARAIASAATKLDPTGGTSNQSRASIDGRQLVVVPKKGRKPSEIGFGQVPSPVMVRGYVCELILQQAGLSLSVLRSLRFPTTEQQHAALTVLTLLAMTGHALAREDGFLRSGCSLIPEEERWGWKRQYGGSAPEPLSPPTIDDLSEALREAITDAEQTGLSFEAPVRLRFSAAQRQLIEERVSAALKAADQEAE